MALAYQHALSPSKRYGKSTPISVSLLAMGHIMTAWERSVFVIVNLSSFVLLMIFSIVMDQTMVLIALIQPLDAPLFGTSSIPMARAYQVAPTLEQMNGMMEVISVIPLVLLGTLISWKTLALTLVSLNTSDSKTISFTVMFKLIPIMEQTLLIPNQGVI